MASRVRWINVGQVGAVGSATVTAATDLITVASHGLSDGDLVAFDTISGATPLEEDVTYYVRNVSGDDFQISGARGGNVLEFTSDGTAEAYTSVPSYSAEELRQTDSHTLFHGSPNRLGAREGVRPGAGVPVTVTGGNWQVQAHTGVVEPAESSTQGPYTYVQLQTTATALNPADGSNDRIDALDVQISDDDADGSEGRGHTIVYVPGTPAGSPSPPPVTARSARLATITVPAGDETASTVRDLAPWTVASGGVLPVRDADELPADTYTGMTAYQEDTGALRVDDGSGWATAGSVHGYQIGETVYLTGSDTFTKADYPGLRAVRPKCQAGGGGGAGTNTTTADECSSSGGGGGGAYAESLLEVDGLGASETVTVGGGGSGGSAGSNGGDGGTSSFGSHVSASGGNGGNTRAPSDGFRASTGGAVQSGGTGDLVIPGGGGGAGFSFGTAVVSSGTADKGIAGRGGSSHLSPGTREGRGPAVVADTGLLYGGGGMGNLNDNSESGKAGGAGAAGIVIVELLY